jgi:hypothetical protein
MERCQQELPPLYNLKGDQQAACFLHDGKRNQMNIDD